MNAWLLLAVAIVLEVGGTVCMKLSQGMTRWLPVAGVVGFYAASFVLVSVAMKSLEVGTAYAVWSGVGTALVTVVGVVLLGESIAWQKVAGIVCICAGVALLKFASPAD